MPTILWMLLLLHLHLHLLLMGMSLVSLVSLLLGAACVVACRKRFRLSPVGARGVKQQRLVLVVLLQQRGVLEPRDHGLFALDARKGHRADLLRVKALPPLSVKGVHERRDVLRVQEVDEAITHIAAVLEVDRQVKEVVGSFVNHIHLLQQHLLVVFIRNIAYLQK